MWVFIMFPGLPLTQVFGRINDFNRGTKISLRLQLGLFPLKLGIRPADFTGTAGCSTVTPQSQQRNSVSFGDDLFASDLA